MDAMTEVQAAAQAAAQADVALLVAKARVAQRAYEAYNQQQVDDVVLAAAWAIMEPSRNRELAAMAVKVTGLGDANDKFKKNYRKTLGLLRDLSQARSVGVIANDPATGITEYARPVGVVGAITPSTNPAATPINTSPAATVPMCISLAPAAK